MARLVFADGATGVLLLRLGIGSVLTMGSGALTAPFGARPIIILGGLALAPFLPPLVMAEPTMPLGRRH